MNTKICVVCKVEKEASFEYWHAQKNGKYGIRSKCKECMKEYSKATKEWRAEWSKKHRAENRDKILEEGKRYYQENKKEVQARHAEWRSKNKEEIRVWHRNNYLRNKDKIKEQHKNYYDENKHKFFNANAKRNARMKNLEHSYTEEQWLRCKDYFDNSCAYCGRKRKLELEHFIPLTKNGEFTVNNIVAACRSCNSSKSSKDFFEWYPTNENFSAKRQQKIMKYLNYKSDIQQLSIF